MDNNLFNVLWRAATGTNDREEYVSEWALSSIWGDPDGADISGERIEALGALWNAAHASIRDIRAFAGLTRTDFALCYLIPYRTVENWERGENQCPDYIRFLLAQVTGFYRRPEG